MLEPRRLRYLTLDAARHPRAQTHLSSASGLALVGRHLYIVADDENHLGRLDARDPAASPLVLIPLAPDTLPADPTQRKAAKRDLESLIVLSPGRPGESLLLTAWGSASRPQREFAYVVALRADGDIAAAPVKIALSALYPPLRERFGELNLEAGFVHDGQVHLFQRAHAGQPRNGHIRFDAQALRDWLGEPRGEPPLPLDMRDLDLGAIDGVPLGITDAAVAPGGGWVFSAVAEDTSDAYVDGACVGSVIGRVESNGHAPAMQRLVGDPKVEGLAFATPERLWLVTDADDPDRPSELLELRWPR